MLDCGAPSQKLHIGIRAEGERGLNGHLRRWSQANAMRRRERRDRADGLSLGRPRQRRQRGHATYMRILMRGKGNEQRVAAAGDEQDIDTPGEDRANISQRVLIVDGAIPGRQQ